MSIRIRCIQDNWPPAGPATITVGKFYDGVPVVNLSSGQREQGYLITNDFGVGPVFMLAWRFEVDPADQKVATTSLCTQRRLHKFVADIDGKSFEQFLPEANRPEEAVPDWIAHEVDWLSNLQIPAQTPFVRQVLEVIRSIPAAQYELRKRVAENFLTQEAASIITTPADNMEFSPATHFADDEDDDSCPTVRACWKAASGSALPSAHVVVNVFNDNVFINNHSVTAPLRVEGEQQRGSVVQQLAQQLAQLK